MADKLTPTQRHLCMSHVKGRNTKPELYIRKFLWNAGYRYRLNVKKLPGTPDIVISRLKIAIFVNGCFWHGHNCKKAVIPQTNSVFWSEKIKKNQIRDNCSIVKLEQLGWNVIVIWECELSSKEKRSNTFEKIISLLHT